MSVLRKVRIASSAVFAIVSLLMFASARGPVESSNHSTTYGMTRAGLEPATYGLKVRILSSSKFESVSLNVSL